METYFYNVTYPYEIPPSQTYKTLQEWNDYKAAQRLPTIIFLGLLIILGIIGNVTVLFVYGFCYTPTSYRLYVLSLAVFDLLSCCIAMPFEMADNLLPLKFNSEILCKMGRFLGTFFRIGSAFLLIVIAVGRYWNICRPHSKPITIKTAKICIGVAIGIALLFSWPDIFIQGLKERNYPGNVSGFDCTMDDDISKTEYPYIYFIFLFTMYLTSFFLLCALYIRMIREIQKHARKSSFKRSVKGQRMSPRITKILCIIALFYIICYLPHCVLDGGYAIKRDYLFPSTHLVLALLPLLSRAYFINNVINPILYFIAEAKFRGVLKTKIQCATYGKRNQESSSKISL